MFFGVQMKILLSKEDTLGQMSLNGGLHLHENESESLHLLAGTLRVTIGDKVLTLNPGESYYAPPNVQHRLQNIGEVPVRALVMTTPGGFDGFIERVGVPIIDGVTLPPPPPPTPEEMAELLQIAGQFGIKIIAPPA